jgi:erythrocyte band 7 integral membrane protein
MIKPLPPSTSNPDQVVDSGSDQNNLCAFFLVALSYVCVVLTFPIGFIFCIKVVQEYERAVIFRLGRNLSGGAKGPGLFFVLPCVDECSTIDLRTITFDVPPQEILTRDSVTITVDAVIYYRIFDPVQSVNKVANAQYSTRLLAATSLRNILGTKTLQEILVDKESIAHHMQELLDTATDEWGVKVERVELKDVRLPVQMQRAMATEAEATREARAKVVAAEGEEKASVALKAAADTINQNPIALQLRYLQTLTHIAAEKNSTIVFPIPLELLRSLPGSNFQKA